MAKSFQRLYLKREFDAALNQWLLWCSCILVLDQIYIYIICKHRANNGIEGSQKINKGFLGALTDLHNLCKGRSKRVALFIFVVYMIHRDRPIFSLAPNTRFNKSVVRLTGFVRI